MPETLDLYPEFHNCFSVRYLLGNSIFRVMVVFENFKGPHEIAIPVMDEKELTVLRASEVSLVA